MFTLWIQQTRKHLVVVTICKCNSISADEPIIDIDENTDLISVVADVILFSPASV